MSLQPKEWKIQYGEKEIPVTSEMITHALDLGISTTHKEIATNRVIRSDARMKMDWDIAVLILELTREQFGIIAEIEVNRQVKRMVPNGQKN